MFGVMRPSKMIAKAFNAPVRHTPAFRKGGEDDDPYASIRTRSCPRVDEGTVLNGQTPSDEAFYTAVCNLVARGEVSGRGSFPCLTNHDKCFGGRGCQVCLTGKLRSPVRFVGRLLEQMLARNSIRRTVPTEQVGSLGVDRSDLGQRTQIP